MTHPPPTTIGMRAALLGMAANVALAGVKITAGILGHSYALVADGVESSVDVLSSFAVWNGLRIAAFPPDENHPYGHGKAESIAGLATALTLLVAAAAIAVESVREIVTPHHAPAPFTLAVLVGVIVVKSVLSRFVANIGAGLESTSLKGESAHHLSDAITSAAAFIGIAVALLGGPGYEPADDWAALFASLVIAVNGVNLLRPVVHEIMDGSVSPELRSEAIALAASVPGVLGIEKCRMRKSGLGVLMDIHVQVDGLHTVEHGHEIGSAVKHCLLQSPLRIVDATVHIEPATSNTSTAGNES